jgi:putative ATP-dependent endonuclease of OLD family
MYISRVVIRNFRNFANLDIKLQPGVTCIVGENNTGKTNLLHGIRLALDVNLSSQYRQLIEQDIHSAVDIAQPQQVLVSLEISDYEDEENECALVGAWETGEEGVARITYRFRPKAAVREEIEAEDRQAGGLTLEDYGWELVGGGDKDPTEVGWNEQMGSSVRFSDLQSFHIVFLQALRDVQQDLHSIRSSPLGRLLSVTDIPEEDKQALTEILRSANQEITNSDAISATGAAIEKEFRATAGDAFGMDVRLGMVEPSFGSIAKALTLLLSNQSLEDFQPDRNGLGINNILYVSMLMEYFSRRINLKQTAGQLLLIEEPEAHLHPQLQRVLYAALKDKGFQTIISTHSTHISSLAPLKSLVILTNRGGAAISSCAVGSSELEEREVADLERYLDATRSTLLYARKVILVEGPAELFLIPALANAVRGVDFDRSGISVIPIYGIHFDAYTKIFSENGLPKKCAVIADGDLKPSDADEDTDIAPDDLESLQGTYVRVFRCKTTFERALTIEGTLKMLRAAAEELALDSLFAELDSAIDALELKDLEDDEWKNLRDSVLSAAKRVGKARFSQVVSKYASLATKLPKYIREAIDWTTED